MTEEDVSNAIEARAAARAVKDFAKADAVREGVAAKGIQIMDTPQGTTWRPGPALGSDNSWDCAGTPYKANLCVQAARLYTHYVCTTPCSCRSAVSSYTSHVEQSKRHHQFDSLCGSWLLEMWTGNRLMLLTPEDFGVSFLLHGWVVQIWNVKLEYCLEHSPKLDVWMLECPVSFTAPEIPRLEASTPHLWYAARISMPILQGFWMEKASDIITP